jgi:hypothetical protein
MLTLLELRKDSRLLAFPLKAAQSIFESLVFFDVYERQPDPPLLFQLTMCCVSREDFIILGAGAGAVNGGIGLKHEPNACAGSEPEREG